MVGSGNTYTAMPAATFHVTSSGTKIHQRHDPAAHLSCWKKPDADDPQIDFSNNVR
jgi:hypothetical protein